LRDVALGSVRLGLEVVCRRARLGDGRDVLGVAVGHPEDVRADRHEPSTRLLSASAAGRVDVEHDLVAGAAFVAWAAEHARAISSSAASSSRGPPAHDHAAQRALAHEVTCAGAVARNSIGIVLVGSMTIGTLFMLFVVPSLCVLIAHDSSAHAHGWTSATWKRRRSTRSRSEPRAAGLFPQPPLRRNPVR